MVVDRSVGFRFIFTKSDNTIRYSISIWCLYFDCEQKQLFFTTCIYSCYNKTNTGNTHRIE